MEKLSVFTLSLLITFMATGNEVMRVNAFQCIEERQVFNCDGCNLVCQVAHFRTSATGRCYSVEDDPATARCYCFASGETVAAAEADGMTIGWLRRKCEWGGW
ncbi:hypothetical protein E3N88_30607 [Mikania micrantha]|uniref:Uncharacterized protein n=1 Tax=Mikania micrantha TaxID=192012 RepID=A0A5N6MMJ9_9ASTR|nr:hypothetical protein E3N88_30607 [Mikania micrantha]